MFCNRCQGSGFLNLEQLEDRDHALLSAAGENWDLALLGWIQSQTVPNDVKVCDCCGDGKDLWYGEPGYHYTHPDEPFAECV